MKSQGFIMAYVIIGVFLLFFIYNFYSSIKPKEGDIRDITKFLQLKLELTKNEILNSIRINTKNYTNNLKNFLNKIEEKMQIKNFVILYHYEKNSSFLNITIYNFLNEDVLVEFYLNNTYNETFVNKFELNKTFFNVNKSSFYILNFSYRGENHSIDIFTNENFTLFKLFSDLQIEEEKSFLRKIFFDEFTI